MSIESIGSRKTEFQDLPRDDRLKIKHQIAEAALAQLIDADDGLLPRPVLVHKLVKNVYNNAAVVGFGLESGIYRGLLKCDPDDNISIADSGIADRLERTEPASDVNA
ncbi:MULTISPECIES: hypothetical protein [Nocardiaceae]|uniref:Uncharacterized protein n=1 Tax=Rhodococcoides corynebacterioides TaxID=53972 RepID=A0ABS2KY32_9NOCA|nr:MULTISPECIES: hypothetical protein [Rhodococcus]MBM7416838.1 hypothetical protein [Rhodococcus corynebacterioides]MBP1115091.1 hypothetical protein [Rhodococcus sp. PvP016]